MKLAHAFEKVSQCEESEDAGKEIIDLTLLSAALRSLVVCRKCRGDNCIVVNPCSRRGLATSLKMYCESCSDSVSFDSSESLRKQEKRSLGGKIYFGIKTKSTTETKKCQEETGGPRKRQR
jgi:hypothetical protein